MNSYLPAPRPFPTSISLCGAPATFWGKLSWVRDAQGKDTDRVAAWHPLVDHCLDVACVVEALLTRTLLGTRLGRCGRQERLDDVQIARLAVFGALHDLGKFNHGFQAKAQPRSAVRKRGHVAEGLALIIGGGAAIVDLVSRTGLAPVLDWAESENACTGLFSASIGHHGRPLRVGTTFDRDRYALWMPQGGKDPLAGIAGLMVVCRAAFPVAFASRGTPLPAIPAFQHAFAGLVMLADWLGSSDRWFPFRSTETEDRVAFARNAAARALVDIGLDAGPARSALKGVSVTLPLLLSGVEPRPLQAAMLDLPDAPTGGVVLLEDETGAGKTEAALIHFLRLHQRGQVDGLYFALPTRTAATEIEKRVRACVARAWPDADSRPPVVLAVPGYVRVDGEDGVRLPRFEVLWPDDAGDVKRSRGWAAENPKRFLAGAVVIGTIDQVLLSVLPLPHAHLRGTALLRQLLVVDEVHASDSYMGRLLERVLREHVRAGGYVLLMSATLGASLRARLERPGQPKRAEAFEVAISRPFPSLVHAPNGGDVVTQPIMTWRSADKNVVMETAAVMETPTEAARLALDVALRGARVLVIRNTVRSCVSTWVALERLAGDADRRFLLTVDGVPAPHHSRFARPDRKALDLAIEAGFGKKAALGGLIAVGTQTLQQSLDLDADLLVTDLCPADVLLQRIGRLYRHDMKRPLGFENPRCIVLVPKDRDLTRWLGRHRRGAPGGLGSVYSDFRGIEATWRQIEVRRTWCIPKDNRELVEAATHSDDLDRLARELGSEWVTHGQEVQGGELAKAVSAGIQAVDRDQSYGEVGFPSEDVAGRITTRLGADDRRVCFKTPFVGPFGAVVKEVQIPGWWPLSPEWDTSSVPVLVDVAEGVACFAVAGQTLIYDRFGLRRAKDEIEVTEELDG